MTIEQVLHHTTGLPPDFDLPEFSDSEAASQHFEPQEFAERFCQPSLASEPGTKWEYSNCGYILLGLVLERATGELFGELMQEKLLDPLGMKDSGIDRNDLVQRGGATGYAIGVMAGLFPKFPQARETPWPKCAVTCRVIIFPGYYDTESKGP